MKADDLNVFSVRMQGYIQNLYPDFPSSFDCPVPEYHKPYENLKEVMTCKDGYINMASTSVTLLSKAIIIIYSSLHLKISIRSSSTITSVSPEILAMAPIKFGILMIEYQTIDVAGPLDILSSCSRKLVSIYEAGGFPGAAGLTGKSIDIEFYHINETMDPVELTANVRIVPTTTCNTCPELDYLLVGGPDPMAFKLSDRFAEFLRAHVAAGKGLFTTCTGSYAVAASGILDGKNATVNHAAIDLCRLFFPKVNWTKESQWVIDGNIWTAAGACAGMDMIADWVMKNYAMELALAGFASLDYQPRDVNRKLLAFDR